MQLSKGDTAGKWTRGNSDISASCMELAEALSARGSALVGRLTVGAEASQHMAQVNGHAKNWRGGLSQRVVKTLVTLVTRTKYKANRNVPFTCCMVNLLCQERMVAFHNQHISAILSPQRRSEKRLSSESIDTQTLLHAVSDTLVSMTTARYCAKLLCGCM